MVSDGSLLLHICTDNISPEPCIASQNKLLGTSSPIGVHWWSRSSLGRALAVTLASHQSYVKQKKPHDVSHLAPTSTLDRKGDGKRACNTGTMNWKLSGANPRLRNHCFGRHACKVPGGAHWPQNPLETERTKKSVITTSLEPHI